MKVIYSEHHRGIVEYPLMEKPEAIIENIASWFLISDLQNYNKWLSSPPIAQVLPEHIEYFSVPRGESEYEIKCKVANANELLAKNATRDMEVKYTKVAIPIKEADLEPGVQSTNEADVACENCGLPIVENTMGAKLCNDCLIEFYPPDQPIKTR